MLFDQIGVKAIVAGGHRRMSRKNNFTRDPRYGAFKADAFVFHPHANRIQHGKSAVTFIQVKHSGLDSELSERAQASHSEQQLLANPDATIAAVQA
jgi:hypothetical protein